MRGTLRRRTSRHESIPGEDIGHSIPLSPTVTRFPVKMIAVRRHDLVLFTEAIQVGTSICPDRDVSASWRGPADRSSRRSEGEDRDLRYRRVSVYQTTRLVLTARTYLTSGRGASMCVVFGAPIMAPLAGRMPCTCIIRRSPQA